jgi:hypothetical protein
VVLIPPSVTHVELVAFLFAATYPERAWAIAVYGGVVRELWAPDFPFGARPHDVEKEIAEFEATCSRPESLTEHLRTALPDAEEKNSRPSCAYGATALHPARWSTLPA